MHKVINGRRVWEEKSYCPQSFLRSRYRFYYPKLLPLRAFLSHGRQSESVEQINKYYKILSVSF